MKLLLNNPALRELKSSFINDAKAKREKYYKDKEYFLTVLSFVQDYQYDNLESIIHACTLLRSYNYRFYLVNNDNTICSYGKLNFPVRFSNEKNAKAFVAKVGVAPHLLKDCMRSMAEFVPEGYLVMKKERQK